MAGAAVHLRYLRYFVAVGETRNLSRAAAQLHVAQPALSRQIRDLERELGVELLERHPKGVTPTPAGEALIHGAPAFWRTRRSHSSVPKRPRQVGGVALCSAPCARFSRLGYPVPSRRS